LLQDFDLKLATDHEATLSARWCEGPTVTGAADDITQAFGNASSERVLPDPPQCTIPLDQAVLEREPQQLVDE
jgi:hypothetical protein